MIVTRTPLRISFLGGGTDYPEWYLNHRGAVLSAAIRRYVYVMMRPLQPFFDNQTRVVWNRIEHVADNSQISHRNVRAALQHFGIVDPVEVIYSSDLPANSGLGSSSSLTVGLALASRAHIIANPVPGDRVRDPLAWDIARDAIKIERDVLGETVGVQDQIAAAHGGFARLAMIPGGAFQRESQLAPDGFEQHLLLVYVGGERVASQVARGQVTAIVSGAKDALLAAMYDSVAAGQEYLAARDFKSFGALVHEMWMAKRSLTKAISTPQVDAVYDIARGKGAWGGKLCGAGGGGFLLLVAPPELHAGIVEAVAPCKTLPVAFDYSGATVLTR